MRFDLHVHTTASDGRYSPRDVVRQALAANLSGLAITDHDTVDGVIPALDFAAESAEQIEIIPGVEFSTDLDDCEIHLLGLFVDHTSQLLLKKLGPLQTARSDRAAIMVDKLHKHGVQVDMIRVAELASGGLYGRPHIARAMVEKGYVKNVKEAFDLYLGHGRPAYHPRYKMAPEEAIRTIRNCGGLSIIAHPGLIRKQHLLERVLEMGVDGIEAHYPAHTIEDTIRYRRLARSRNLLLSGGSDYHGEPKEYLGMMSANEYLYRAMKTRLKLRP